MVELEEKRRPVVAQPLVEPRLPERPLRSKRTRACSSEPAVVTRVNPPLALGPELVGRPPELKPGVFVYDRELLAGLGAAVVATLGVLIVRILNAPSQTPAVPAASPRPADGGVKRAA
jgi:hypothetical protein